MKKSLLILLCALAALTVPALKSFAAEPLSSRLRVQLGSALLGGDPIGPGILAGSDFRSEYAKADLGKEVTQGQDAAATGNGDPALPLTEDLAGHGFKTRTAFTPYLGAGTAPADSGPAISGIEDAADTYRLAAGIGYELDASTTLDLGYRGALSAPPVMEQVLEDALTADFDDHNISFGLKMLF